MLSKFRHLLVIVIAGLVGLSAIAADDPTHERHELMEGVRDAAKPIGAMFRGEAEYDQDTVMASLRTFEDSGARFGDLFPDGSQGGEAAPAIWEDRDGFDEQLSKWRAATAAAIEANPGSLEEAQVSVGPVFKSCKGCHDSYRIEDEDE